jgi:DNA replication protein DnaC
MIYSNELFAAARDIIDARRAQAEAENARRLMEFERLEPRYKTLKNEMIDSMRIAMSTVGADRETTERVIAEQRERNLSAQREIRELLLAHGLPEDWLEVHYTCQKCGDTGSVGIELCECFEDVLKTLAFEEANKRSPLRFSTFEEFRLDYYSDTVNPAYKCSPRARMEETLALCREYAEGFDRESQNLYLCGATGLGKTHLSLAIAGEVIKKGYRVLYNSAQNIFNELQKERFGKGDADGRFEPMVLECDLLVIDDLGAEFSTQFTNAALYNIINTRINSGLPTIISTNLNMKGLEERYTRRVSSRLIGEYAVINFIGEDVRQIRSERAE